MSERITIGAIGRTGESLQFVGRVLAEAAANSGLHPLLVPEHGLRPRGDRSAFRLTLDVEPVLVAGEPDWLLVCGPDLHGWDAPNKLIDADRAPQIDGWQVHASQIAHQTEWPQGANMVLLGALSQKMPWLTETAVLRALKELLPDHPRRAAQNLACFRAGR